MEMSALVLLGIFFILLFLNVPISFCIGLATLGTMLLSMDLLPALTTLAQRMAGGLNSFALLAIPFFVLSGLLMGRGGIAKRLIECAMALVGALPGGLALVNVLSCMLFGAISGSAVAATSAIGSFMLPEMKKQGYDDSYSAAVTAAAAPYVTGAVALYLEQNANMTPAAIQRALQNDAFVGRLSNKTNTAKYLPIRLRKETPNLLLNVGVFRNKIT